MLSIVTGFEYDIFISYRQKDNKYLATGQAGDGWVSDFVAYLRKNLKLLLKTIYRFTSTKIPTTDSARHMMWIKASGRN